MKRQKYILTLILVLAYGITFAHQDFWIIKDFGNVRVRIKTGFEYEEIYKVLIFGQLAEKYAKEIHYSKPIFLDFHHHYTENCEPDFFLSYDRAKIKNSWNDEGKNFLKHTSIVIRQVARRFDAETTLKLLEYGILNVSVIKSTQKEIEYNKNFCQWNINSIDTILIKKQLDKPGSNQVNNILGIRIERPAKDFKYGVSYYLKDNKYTIFSRQYNDIEKNLITLDNIYDLKKIDDISMVFFETDSSFYYINSYKKQVSERHVIQDTNDYFKPYKIESIGGSKLSIYFSYYYASKEEGNRFVERTKERTLIYLTDKDELIQDLDKLIDKK